jgi:hypothetical protein
MNERPLKASFATRLGFHGFKANQIFFRKVAVAKVSQTLKAVGHKETDADRKDC